MGQTQMVPIVTHIARYQTGKTQMLAAWVLSNFAVNRTYDSDHSVWFHHYYYYLLIQVHTRGKFTGLEPTWVFDRIDGDFVHGC